MITSKQFPPEWKQHINNPTTKAALFSEIAPLHPRDCRNCGGIGTMVVFIAIGGPFMFPPSGKGIVAKWHDGKWWGGKHIEEKCPVCKGNGIIPGFVEADAVKREYSTAGVLKMVDAEA